MPPEVILAIDTSAAHCAAALLLGNSLTTRCEEMAKGQAERLPVLVQELLASQGLTLADVTGLGVGVGPGNFTGIRIAVSFVRGLALGLGVPARGVTTFEAVAANHAFPFWALAEAPRGEVYAQRFPGGAATILTSEAAQNLDAKVYHRNDVTGADLVGRIAEITHMKQGLATSRPAPFYLRGADAAPPSDPPPIILDLAAP